mgnify:CR=1 FL=1
MTAAAATMGSAASCGRAPWAPRPRNDIVIADPAVSSAHAIISYEKGNYTIRDLGSRNGTYLNGDRLTSAAAANFRAEHAVFLLARS